MDCRESATSSSATAGSVRLAIDALPETPFVPRQNSIRRLLAVTRIITIAAMIVFSARSVAPQSSNASVTGRITDSTKAVTPDAKVIAINTGTRVRFETVTNETGSYYVTNLPPGTYRIEVEKLGFTAVLKSDVILHVQDALEINFEMVLGSASESVTVRGGAPLLDTESSTMGTVVEQRKAVELPLNGRNVF
jgi:type 1 fimbria pilin